MKLYGGLGRLKPVFKPKRYTTVVALLIVGAGFASALFAGVTGSIQQREYLIGRSQTISNTMSIDDIEKLSGSLDDVSKPEYSKVKQRLQQVNNTNNDLSRIHLFIIRDGKIVIAADSKTPDAEGYVAPGSEYVEASEALRSTFQTALPQHDYLITDLFGRWTASYTPVYDVQTNQVIGAVGTFKEATSYYFEIVTYALVPLLLAAIPLAGILRDIKIQAKEHEILQLKNQFVSIASHELRSPLTGMLWGIQSLQQADTKLTDTQKSILQDMFQSTEASLATVNEILDLSIFERGQNHQFRKDTVDIHAVIKQVASTLKLAAGEKHITIRTSDRAEQAYTTADVGALKRAFMNIIANAIKYSPNDSEIVLQVRKSPTNEYITTVTDKGIGIPPDEQEKVLEGYYRASNATQVQAHGTGLGLWVTKKIIEDHGGRIWLNSAVGSGTTVTVALPALITRQQPEESAGSKTPEVDSSLDTH